MKNITFFFISVFLAVIVGMISVVIGNLFGYERGVIYTNYLVVTFGTQIVFNQVIILKNATKN